MAGTEEKLTTRRVQEKAAATYRPAFSEVVTDKKIQAEDEEVHLLDGGGGADDTGHGVLVASVPGAGYHLQNDVTWEAGAEKLLAFLRQL
ncbi:hypothetical protein DL771_008865 [Monosporascus sp. 5C6A]|nr:hypothetical protein DL771_008865 [Monosporascus sp. 5C6A]